MHRTVCLGSHELEQAALFLKEGLLVAFPTETVYGLGAALFNPKAIESIFKAKGRPADNPLIAHLSSLKQVDQIAEEIPDCFHLLAESFFPGPLTVVLKRKANVHPIVSGGLNLIALRIPSHPIASALISLVGEPIVAPSANISGKPSSTQASHVLEDFEGKIAAVIDGGKTDHGIESTVVSLLGAVPVLLRPGAITKEQIEQVLGFFLQSASNDSERALSPGMKYRHYSPKAAIKIFQTFEEIENYLFHAHPSQRMFLSQKPLKSHLKSIESFILTAKEFYSLLRFADQKNYDEILVLCDEELQRQDALMNRLFRSAGLS